MKKVVISVAGALLFALAVPKIVSATSLERMTQQDSQQKTKTFSGTVIKNGDNFVLT